MVFGLIFYCVTVRTLYRFGRVELTSVSVTVTVSEEGLDIKEFIYILNIEL